MAILIGNRYNEISIEVPLPHIYEYIQTAISYGLKIKIEGVNFDESKCHYKPYEIKVRITVSKEFTETEEIKDNFSYRSTYLIWSELMKATAENIDINWK